jgi:threonine dehydrogenase-like Zn-dependent dehydrogenase
MKALCWHGKSDMRYETVPDPEIVDPRMPYQGDGLRDLRVDLHIYNGVIPAMESGDVLGHETMGEVVEVGSANKKLKVGDRIVVPFTISCGECFFCKRGYYSGCERSNPMRLKPRSCGATRGHLWLLIARRVSGGQAEYLRALPSSARSGLRADDQSCSSPTSFRPATWPPTSATSRMATPLPSGAAARSASLRSKAPSCWEPAA